MLCSCEPALLSLSMCRGGRRPGSGVKKGDKAQARPVQPYSKKKVTKKNSKPTEASKAMLASFIARGNDDEEPHDGHDGGAPAAAV